MSLLEITVQPDDSVSHFRTTVLLPELDATLKRWTFDFYTNTADGAWYFDLENDGGEVAIRGIGLANGINLLYPYRYLDLPPGSLFVRDKGLEGADPDLQSFADGRAALYYFIDDGLP